ncbi:hypothetical protein Ccrd_023965 [Cynara cardunculus var. scolymus]|uniref:Uncharacterized protein n=1 Tax=Cynara cardunculus var. scolymus TaxID=59895 RepID=A0A118E3X0_CYNCS|nr:hypothetical protein Ccrd_023965 [Cynara cardunculus var. scolymus]
MAICEVQQATQEAEEALTQGLEALNQSLSDTIASDALSSPTNMLTTWGEGDTSLPNPRIVSNFKEVNQ